MPGDIWTLWLRLKNNFGVHILVEFNVINIFVLPDPSTLTPWSNPFVPGGGLIVEKKACQRDDKPTLRPSKCFHSSSLSVIFLFC